MDTAKKDRTHLSKLNSIKNNPFKCELIKATKIAGVYIGIDKRGSFLYEVPSGFTSNDLRIWRKQNKDQINTYFNLKP